MDTTLEGEFFMFCYLNDIETKFDPHGKMSDLSILFFLGAYGKE